MTAFREMRNGAAGLEIQSSGISWTPAIENDRNIYQVSTKDITGIRGSMDEMMIESGSFTWVFERWKLEKSLSAQLLLSMR